MTREACAGMAAGVLNTLSLIPYVLSILRGETKPNRATWLIWALLSVSIAWSYYSAGARNTAWVCIPLVLGPMICFTLSLRYGEGGVGSFDLVSLIGAVLAWIAWTLCTDKVYALCLGLLVEVLGYGPVLIKVIREPLSENRLSWLMTGLGNALNCCAVSEWSFSIALPPVVFAAMSTLVVVLQWFPRYGRVGLWTRMSFRT